MMRKALVLSTAALALTCSGVAEAGKKNPCDWKVPEDVVVLAKRCDVKNASKTVIQLMDVHPGDEEGLQVQEESFAAYEDLVTQMGSFPLVIENFPSKSVEAWIDAQRSITPDYPYYQSFAPLFQLFAAPVSKRPQLAREMVGVEPVLASITAAIAYQKTIRPVAPLYDKESEQRSTRLIERAKSDLKMFGHASDAFCLAGETASSLTDLMKLATQDRLEGVQRDCYCGLLDRIETGYHEGMALRESSVAKAEADTALSLSENFVVVSAGAKHAPMARQVFDEAGVNYLFVTGASAKAAQLVFTQTASEPSHTDRLSTFNGVDVCKDWTPRATTLGRTSYVSPQ